jgi:hypothetical protein
MVICFLLGTIYTFAGLGIWVWNQGFQSVAIVVTIVLSLVGGCSGLVLLLLVTGR